jgi:hypothetical protein
MMVYQTMTLWKDEQGRTWQALRGPANHRDLSMGILKDYEVARSIAWAQSHNLEIVDERRCPASDNPPSADQQTGRRDLAGDQSAEQAKHAPGPWEIEFDGRWATIFSQSMDVCELFRAGDTPAQLVDANARLIASAPDMLEALKAIGARSVVDVYDDEAELRRQLFHINSIANAALAKAEGRDR